MSEPSERMTDPTSEYQGHGTDDPCCPFCGEVLPINHTLLEGVWHHGATYRDADGTANQEIFVRFETHGYTQIDVWRAYDDRWFSRHSHLTKGERYEHKEEGSAVLALRDVLRRIAVPLPAAAPTGGR